MILADLCGPSQLEARGHVSRRLTSFPTSATSVINETVSQSDRQAKNVKFNFLLMNKLLSLLHNQYGKIVSRVCACSSVCVCVCMFACMLHGLAQLLLHLYSLQLRRCRHRHKAWYFMSLSHGGASVVHACTSLCDSGISYSSWSAFFQTAAGSSAVITNVCKNVASAT